MLENPTQNIVFLIPEIFLFGLFLVNILVDLLFGKSNRSISPAVSIIGILVTIILTGYQYKLELPTEPFFYKMLIINYNHIFLKLLLGVFTLVTFIWFNISQATVKSAFSELHSFVISSLLGSFIMIQSSHFMSLFLGLEIVSISSYILAHYSFNKKAAESSLKYFIYGAFSSGLMVYGISFLYGFGGSFQFTQIDFINRLSLAPNFFLILSLALLLCGLFFKISIFPFHSWVPDVYEGASSSIVAYFSVVPKSAGLIALFNIYEAFSSNGIINNYMVTILSTAAMASILVGNLSALWQNDFKRMIAYSSIAQAGFILACILPISSYSTSSFIFYLIMYFFMNYGALFISEILSSAQNDFQIKKLSGLGRNYPLIGILLLVIMVSLVGLPPTAGFSAKFLLFTSLYEFSQNSKNYLVLGLFLVAIVNTIVSLFFYLKPVYFLFLKRSEKQTLVIFELKSKIFCIILVLPLIIGFFSFDKFVHLIQQLNGF